MACKALSELKKPAMLAKAEPVNGTPKFTIVETLPKAFYLSCRAFSLSIALYHDSDLTT
jgi:hypothetical protein